VKFKIQKEKMLSHQKKWWELDTFYKLLIGGYGCGKTYIGALRSIYLSYVNKPLPGMYISPSYALSQKTIIITLKDIMRRTGMDYNYNQMRNEFHIKNWNGLIWIGSGDNPDSLRGPNLAWSGIDEPFIQKKEVFDQMIARVRHPESSHREIFLTGTPEQLNWGFELSNKTDMDIGVVVGSTIDNEHLPQDYKDNLMAAYSEEQIRAYVHGEFVNLTQGRVYQDFKNEYIQKFDYTGMEIAGCCDFNVDALTAIIFAHGKNRIHAFKEYRLRNAGTYDLAQAIKKDYPGITIYPDATGSARKTSGTSGSDHDILRQNGFRVITGRSNPPVKDRINAVNRVFRKGIASVDNCKNLIKDLQMNVYRNNQIDKTSDPEQTHASDAFGYAVSKLMPIRSRVPISVEW
jgi:PBSX family phage terminase large subunit